MLALRFFSELLFVGEDNLEIFVLVEVQQQQMDHLNLATRII